MCVCVCVALPWRLQPWLCCAPLSLPRDLKDASVEQTLKNTAYPRRFIYSYSAVQNLSLNPLCARVCVIQCIYSCKAVLKTNGANGG